MQATKHNDNRGVKMTFEEIIEMVEKRIEEAEDDMSEEEMQDLLEKMSS